MEETVEVYSEDEKWQVGQIIKHPYQEKILKVLNVSSEKAETYDEDADNYFRKIRVRRATCRYATEEEIQIFQGPQFFVKKKCGDDSRIIIVENPDSVLDTLRARGYDFQRNLCEDGKLVYLMDKYAKLFPCRSEDFRERILEEMDWLRAQGFYLINAAPPLPPLPEPPQEVKTGPNPPAIKRVVSREDSNKTIEEKQKALSDKIREELPSWGGCDWQLNVWLSERGEKRVYLQTGWKEEDVKFCYYHTGNRWHKPGDLELISHPDTWATEDYPTQEEKEDIRNCLAEVALSWERLKMTCNL